MSVRLLRGRVAIRETTRGEYKGAIWTPERTAREVRTHTGIVLGKGPPALLGQHEVPHGFEVGDKVVYHFEHNEEARTRVWPDDGEKCVLMTQQEIDAVIE